MQNKLFVANTGGISLNGFDDAGYAELVAGGISSLRDAVGMFDQQVAGRERDVARGTVPFGKQADDCGGGGQGLDGAVGTEEQGGMVAAIGVFEFAQVIVDGREQAKRQGSGSRKRRQAFRRRDVVVV